jgi:hypothetical protein
MVILFNFINKFKLTEHAMPPHRQALSVGCKFLADSNRLCVMIYFIWTLINFGLFISFIVVSLRAAKLVREKLGVLATALFALGLLSFVVASDDNDNLAKSGLQKIWTFTPVNNVNETSQRTIYATIDKHMGSTIDLSVVVARQKSTNTILEASSMISGLVGGYKWKPTTIVVDKSPEQDVVTYLVVGVLEWKLWVGQSILSPRN